MRNADIKRILASRAIAEEQNRTIRETLKKRRKPQYLEHGYVKNAVWPKSKRVDKE